MGNGTGRAAAVVLAALLWLLALHALGLHLFTTGFFLTRREVPLRSHCRAVPDDALQHHPATRPPGGLRVDRGCWMRPRWKRAVLVIIDALRLDFVQHWPPNSLDEQQQLYRNNMPVFDALLRAHPTHAALLRAEVDPPTVTMQRLKGITTGSLPTFVDVGSNFAGVEILEDNLIAQLASSGHNLTFMGDDTWDSLFPSQFNRSFPYPSFNVKDLHTVDNGCIAHLMPELARNASRLLVAHFLGVDHAGHKYGPEHPAMRDKMQQMDAVLRALVAALPPESLLVVMGDHGMTGDGNHGGATEEEVGAALFLYSTSHPLLPHEASAQACRNGCGGGHVPSVAQIDVVPSLALALGVPVPFGNLGTVLPHLFEGAAADEVAASETATVAAAEAGVPSDAAPPALRGVVRAAPDAPPADAVAHPLRPYERALLLNAAQVRQYLREYVRASSELSAADIAQLGERYLRARDAMLASTLRAGGGGGEADAAAQRRAAVEELVAFLRAAGSLCRAQWTTFGMGSIGAGVAALWLSAAAVAALLARYTRIDSVTTALQWSVAAALAGGVGAAAAALAVVGRDSAALSCAEAAAALLGAAVLAAALCVPAWHASPLRPLPRRPSSALLWVGPCVVLAMHLAALTSNSYINAQDAVVAFLLASLALHDSFAMVRASVRHAHRPPLRLRHWLAALLCAALPRVETALKLPGIDRSEATALATWLPCAAAAAACVLATARLCHARGRSAFAAAAVCATGALCIAAVCAACVHWAMSRAAMTTAAGAEAAVEAVEAVEAGAGSDGTEGGDPVSPVLPPRIAYALAALAVMLWWHWAPRASAGGSAAPATLILVALPLAVPVALVSGAQSPLLLLLAATHAWALLGCGEAVAMSSAGHAPVAVPAMAADVARAAGAATTAGAASAAGAGVASAAGAFRLGVAWHTLAWHLYFASGHHNSFSALPYGAGFVGVNEFSMWASGPLFALNVAAFHLLLPSLLPLALAAATRAAESQAAPAAPPAPPGATDKPARAGALLAPAGALLALLLCSSLTCAVTTTFVAAQRRHLMVWAIFAPKFVFDALALAVVCVGCVGGWVLWVRQSGCTLFHLRAAKPKRQ